MSLEVIFLIAIALAEISLIVTAYLITTWREIPKVIQAYRTQSFLLTLAAILIATVGQWKNLVDNTPLEKLRHMFASQTLGAIALIALLPLGLGLSIRWILARATVYEPGQERVVMLRQAQAAWLEPRYGVSGKTTLYFLALVVLSFAIVFLGINFSGIDINNEDEKLGISVSLLLHLAGLYNTLSRKDVISQMIGVLTMDQGMLLAIVKIVSIPVPATLFVIAVYFYTLITLILLFLIVPSLRRVRESINLDEIAAQSDLKG